MTSEELQQWKYKYASEIIGSNKHIEVDGVHFNMFGENCISYRYGNASGLVFADSYFNGPDDHDPGCRISPRYSDECKYRPLCLPNLRCIAASIKESWSRFSSGG